MLVGNSCTRVANTLPFFTPMSSGEIILLLYHLVGCNVTNLDELHRGMMVHLNLRKGINRQTGIHPDSFNEQQYEITK